MMNNVLGVKLENSRFRTRGGGAKQPLLAPPRRSRVRRLVSSSVPPARAHIATDEN